MAELSYQGGLPGQVPEQADDLTASPMVETTFGEGLAATLSSIWQDNSLNRITDRAPDTLAAAQEPDWGARNQPSAETQAMEQERGPGPDITQVQPEDANAQIKARGANLTPFTHPVTQGTLDNLIESDLTKQRAAAVIARSHPGVLGTVAQFSTAALASLADPVNLAAMMIPGPSDAFLAAKVADLGGGIAANIGVHTAASALHGAASMAAVVPAQALLAARDHEDYSVGDALRQVMFGAALGAGSSILRQGYLAARGRALWQQPSAPTLEDAMKASLGRVMTDDPRGVDVQSILDAGAARDAVNNLSRWQDQQQRVFNDRAGLETLEPRIGRGAEIDTAQARMETAYERARQMRSEAVEASVGTDPALQARIEAIDEELGRVIPKQRRAALQDERTMLMGGDQAVSIAAERARQAPFMNGAPDEVLAQARAGSQTQGLLTGAERAQAEGAAAERQMNALSAKDAAEQALYEDRRNSSIRATRIAQLALDGREQAIQGQMEAEIRRYAYRRGVDLQPGEAAVAAREIRQSYPSELKDTIESHLIAIGRRATRQENPFPAATGLRRGFVETRPKPPAGTPNAAAGLRREASDAAQEMATRAQTRTDPELVQANNAIAQAAEAAPKLEGKAAADLAAINDMVAQRKAMYDAQVVAGLRPESPTINEAGTEEINLGKASNAYAACFGAMI